MAHVMKVELRKPNFLFCRGPIFKAVVYSDNHMRTSILSQKSKLFHRKKCILQNQQSFIQEQFNFGNLAFI